MEKVWWHTCVSLALRRHKFKMQLGLCREFKANLGYISITCLKMPKCLPCKRKLGVLAQAYKPSVEEVETDRYLGLADQPILLSEFQASMRHIQKDRG